VGIRKQNRKSRRNRELIVKRERRQEGSKEGIKKETKLRAGRPPEGLEEQNQKEK
jgi:hypothetical protein